MARADSPESPCLVSPHPIARVHKSQSVNSNTGGIANLNPLEVKITGTANQPLSAGKRYDLVCTTSGSRPPAGITWWRNGQRLVDSKENVIAPTCKPNQTKVHGVAKQEKANISCQVDANPPEVQFKWTFNNSAESIDVAAGHIARAGTSSIVSYTPMTELDYGTLLCWASNHIGQQQVPCVYHIIPAGKVSPHSYPYRDIGENVNRHYETGSQYAT
ncbi:neuronal growth regulator 1 [Lasius niger]|uniref:Neuronal growth regulator 1 n=1 Tax=Lasius niger TaxID=67767 RepID=A0A0J7L0G8_LASNI|nr:neuronal growth regulator 1 [Lasius niger]